LQYLRRQGGKVRTVQPLGSNPVKVVAKPVAQPKPAKATKAPKAPKADKAKRSSYDTDKLVHMYMEKGLTVREIAESGVEGLKGISRVYVHRHLFGSENSGGVSKEQTARRKEQERRVAARRKLDGKLDK
jgi:hypothetical protein